MKDFTKDYRKIEEDHFPESIKLVMGDQTLVYKKRTWKVKDEDSGLEVARGLRYGENPGQEAALYQLINGNLALGECRFVGNENQLVSSLVEDDLMQVGKHPSLNNLTDVDAALNILRYFDDPTSIIIKHNNPSGVASRSSLKEAYLEAHLADTVAAFGGVAVFNREVDEQTAVEVNKNYLEVTCAPGYSDKALEILKRKKNLRIIKMHNIKKLRDNAYVRHLDIKSLIDSGLVMQQSMVMTVKSKDDFLAAKSTHNGKEHVVQREPTDEEYEDLLFAWKVQQGVTSNSVIFVKNKSTVAIGTGEQDRVGVAKIAAFKAREKYAARLSIEKYGEHYWLLKDPEKKTMIDSLVEQSKGNLNNSVMASDGFFPFRDTVDIAATFGVKAIVQPGGSIRDFESIDACNEHKIAMVFTGQRAFRH